MEHKRKMLALNDPLLYEAELAKLVKKREYGDGLSRLTQEGLSLGAASFRSRKFAKMLARTVGQGEFEFGPCYERRAFVGGKERTLYRYDLVDNIVEGVVARALGDLVRPHLSKCVYSYLKGRSSLEAIGDFASYVRAHVKERPDVKERGLYVLRRDISSYGESIPVDDESALWRLLAVPIKESQDPNLERLVRAAIRPMVVKQDDTKTHLEVGVPTGSKIQPVACNLYLRDLDKDLESLEGGFYARYGDDILFAHTDPSVAEEASEIVQSRLSDLRLSLNTNKSLDLYFTKPGRPSSASWTTKPASHVEYLGCGVSFDGGIRLKQAKADLLLKDIKARVRSTKRALVGQSVSILAQTLCEVVNRTLNPSDELSHPSAVLLMRVVNHRGQLKHLDYLVALVVSQNVSGIRGVKSFREVSYKKLRQVYGLASLVNLRNKGRAGA